MWIGGCRTFTLEKPRYDPLYRITQPAHELATPYGIRVFHREKMSVNAIVSRQHCITWKKTYCMHIPLCVVVCHRSIIVVEEEAVTKRRLKYIIKECQAAGLGYVDGNQEARSPVGSTCRLHCRFPFSINTIREQKSPNDQDPFGIRIRKLPAFVESRKVPPAFVAPTGAPRAPLRHSAYGTTASRIASTWNRSWRSTRTSGTGTWSR